MENEDKILTKIRQLLSKERMKERDGDEYGSRQRPKNGFTACELYTDSSLGMSEREVFGHLNSLVRIGRLKIRNLIYYLVR